MGPHSAQHPPIPTTALPTGTAMISLLLTVFTRTPPWVWLILAGLVALGLMQAQDHSVSVSHLLAQPLVQGALSLQSAIAAFGLKAWTLLGWPLGARAWRVLRLGRAPANAARATAASA